MRKSIIQAIPSVFLFLISGYSNFALAHDVSGSLGKAKSGSVATDIYEVSCLNDGSGEPTKLMFQVIDTAPVKKPTISIQAVKIDTGERSIVSTDPKDGDKKYSPLVGFAPIGGGTGVYQMIITKSQTAPIVKGFELYKALYHCYTATNEHTGTVRAMTQNQ
jgi:hypothetical protein